MIFVNTRCNMFKTCNLSRFIRHFYCSTQYLFQLDHRYCNLLSELSLYKLKNFVSVLSKCEEVSCFIDYQCGDGSCFIDYYRKLVAIGNHKKRHFVCQRRLVFRKQQAMMVSCQVQPQNSTLTTKRHQRVNTTQRRRDKCFDVAGDKQWETYQAGPKTVWDTLR